MIKEGECRIVAKYSGHQEIVEVVQEDCLADRIEELYNELRFDGVSFHVFNHEGKKVRVKVETKTTLTIDECRYEI
jgi:hypothetical protein